MKATLVVLGTAFSLTNVDHVYSAVSKSNYKHIMISNFPTCDEEDVSQLLGKLIDMSDCKIQPEKRQKLVGRCRFTTYVLFALAESGVSEPGMSKQEILNKAIDTAIEKAKTDIETEVSKLLNSNISGNDIHLLSRMVIAFKLTGGRMTFKKPTEADFVNCFVGSIYSFWIEEPLVIEVVEDELRKKINLEFDVYLQHLNSIYTTLDTSSSSRGGIFERLVGETLKLFEGTPLLKLPFLKNIKNLPQWCKETTLWVKRVGTAKELGYSDGLRGDKEYFEHPQLYEMLYPNHNTRPDVMLLHRDKRNYESWLSVAIKFESSPLNSKTNDLNDTSCDPRLCFPQDGWYGESIS
ncbi:hypothetical protein BC937DRAFT_89555 [Endogone sp. FLAS-F59071]|nr:hypothetical protein BC937DRAFT_89555 [Endogone sp. FLAS-F59071]|eukprot:RUS17733.1 hypothetical protein BC937DRAFT_89555 [Endogone sp. FLAS-F59071]